MVNKGNIIFGLIIICLVGYIIYDTRIILENTHYNIYRVNLPAIKIYIAGPKCALEEKNYSYHNETCTALVVYNPNISVNYTYIVDCNIKIEINVQNGIESYRVLTYTCQNSTTTF